MGRGAASSPFEISHHSLNGHWGNSFLHGLWHRSDYPSRVKVSSFRYENFDEEVNTLLLVEEKDIIEERREVTRIRIEAQK